MAATLWRVCWGSAVVDGPGGVRAMPSGPGLLVFWSLPSGWMVALVFAVVLCVGCS